MLDLTVQLVLFAALLVHGIGHGGALGALAWTARSPGSTGHWLPAKSWLFPAASGGTATAVASTFWVVSLVGFVLVALSFWGFVVPGSIWRPLAILSALISAAGIVLFLRTWPVFNTVAALGMNVVAVLAAVAWPA